MRSVGSLNFFPGEEKFVFEFVKKFVNDRRYSVIDIEGKHLPKRQTTREFHYTDDDVLVMCSREMFCSFNL